MSIFLPKPFPRNEGQTSNWRHMVSVVEADHVDEIVYRYEIVDPAGPDGSITIAHGFTGMRAAKPGAFRERDGA